ncbi:MAG: ethanolamine ammonia-lyase subunit EutC [Chitinophagaceae bacterium]
MELKNTPGKDQWEALKQFTTARIALGRTGSGVPTSALLQFKLAHAHARDAVHSRMDTSHIIEGLKERKLSVIEVASKATDRIIYLQRPDLGREPDPHSITSLQEQAFPCDVCIVIADGLSAQAINLNALPLLDELIPLLQAAGRTLAPVCVATQARVALADHIAFHLKARLSVILIGERPGLSASDSMGAYLTFEPKPGLTDDSRNCISNIRPEGISSERAAAKLFYLIQEAFERKISGVALKDNYGLLNGTSDERLL